MLLLVLAMLVFFAFYIGGFKETATAAQPDKLASQALNAVNFLNIFASLTALLLMAHEYRYNTISYALTATKNRLSILFAKIFVTSCFALLLALLLFTLAPALTYLGLRASGTVLAPQTFHVWNLLWRSLFVMWGAAMYGLLLATLIRRQVGAIATLFIMAVTVEQLLALLLKEKAGYLPFTALGSLVAVSGVNNGPIAAHLSTGRALAAVMSYIVGGWIIAWILFIRRDAN
jgi:hypothetical protein